MKIVSLLQGSAEWHAHRAQHFNASDAPAMMSCSPYKTRTELIKELATGITAEVDAATQRIFDAGHQFEALARPLAEEIVGEELYPVVGAEGKYSASFDGLTMLEDAAFEHKSLNAALREAMFEGCAGSDLPLVYQVQMEQQAMVSGCARILFMASKWEAGRDTGEMVLVEQHHCWYTPNLDLRARIVAGWAELEAEVAAFDPSAQRAAPAVAAPVDSLPAVAVQLQGALAVVSNLPAFGEALRAFIDRIPAKPATDQEFADTEAACKALKKAEDMLEATEAGALAQISDVELLRRTVSDLRSLARSTRLAKEKLVTAEKEARRTQIVTGAQAALDQHVQVLNQRLGANWIPRVNGGFGEVIKGKKSLANMEDAVAVALTDAKHEANLLAQRLEANRAHLMQEDGDWIALFADFGVVGAKAAEDFEALAALRIGNHKQAEAKRLEGEREKIRAQEQTRAEATVRAEQEQKRQAEEAEAAAARAKALQAEQEAQAAIADARKAESLPAPLLSDLSAVATHVRGEATAAIDAGQVISAAKSATAPADTGETMTLGQINTLIAPIKVDAAGLAELGFTPSATVKAAKHFRASDVPRILAAMVKHLQGAMATA
ncbi:YqaJ viral recombinase family protein [Acidovorax sp. CCYZU-2555]|uniref:YqaJ viral recombinase family protein n=1 Tax=Acidovorax sp. CCYZU-2555 TaxID=2835042 RepID=UPI001BCE7E05|nr:YqaJ viral recombinase family protein [Acidovorax sp. CCYZU-2555]MBS7777657.1 YqaJ viral recombinase family protein [Acidovorax sp. CCYZU-2555]